MMPCFEIAVLTVLSLYSPIRGKDPKADPMNNKLIKWTTFYLSRGWTGVVGWGESLRHHWKQRKRAVSGQRITAWWQRRMEKVLLRLGEVRPWGRSVWEVDSPTLWETGRRAGREESQRRLFRWAVRENPATAGKDAESTRPDGWQRHCGESSHTLRPWQITGVYTESSYMFQSSYKTMEIVLHITFHNACIIAEASVVSCWRQKWVCTAPWLRSKLNLEKSSGKFVMEAQWSRSWHILH